MAIIRTRSSLLSPRTLRQLGQAARSVARLELNFADGRRYGTGFLVAPEYLLTACHIVAYGGYKAVQGVVADFDFEEGFTGTPLIVNGIVPPVAMNAEHDWAVIRLERAIDDRVPIALGTAWAIAKEDQTIIVQHPQGAFKKIALDVQSVQYFDDDVIQYRADTMAGSAGSPVFNATLHCIALHHAGLPDETGLPSAWRNEGISIKRVMEGLRAAGIPFNDDPTAYIAELEAQSQLLLPSSSWPLQPPPPSLPIAFLGYASTEHDTAWMQRLRQQLIIVVGYNQIEPWEEGSREMSPEREKARQNVLERASVALLLITADYLAYDYVREKLLPRLKERLADGLTVIPVIVKKTNYQLSHPWLAEIEPWPSRATSLQALTDAQADEALAALAVEVYNRLAEAAAQSRPGGTS